MSDNSQIVESNSKGDEWVFGTEEYTTSSWKRQGDNGPTLRDLLIHPSPFRWKLNEDGTVSEYGSGKTFYTETPFGEPELFNEDGSLDTRWQGVSQIVIEDNGRLRWDGESPYVIMSGRFLYLKGVMPEEGGTFEVGIWVMELTMCDHLRDWWLVKRIGMTLPEA